MTQSAVRPFLIFFWQIGGHRGAADSIRRMEPQLDTHRRGRGRHRRHQQSRQAQRHDRGDVAGAARAARGAGHGRFGTSARTDRRGPDLLRRRRHLLAAGARRGTQTLAVQAEEALATFPKPTLAAVRGYCVGGGCQLAAACDLRFAEDDALFGVTPAKLGIVYPASTTRRLVSLVGPATAKYLLFSGELIDTERALRTGLVDEVLPKGELGKRVAEFTRIIASRSQLTQAAAKEFATGRTDRDAHWEEQAHAGGDTAEGVAAFLERRAPRFTWSV